MNRLTARLVFQPSYTLFLLSFHVVSGVLFHVYGAVLLLEDGVGNLRRVWCSWGSLHLYLSENKDLNELLEIIFGLVTVVLLALNWLLETGPSTLKSSVLENSTHTEGHEGRWLLGRWNDRFTSFHRGINLGGCGPTLILLSDTLHEFAELSICFIAAEELFELVWI